MKKKQIYFGILLCFTTFISLAQKSETIFTYGGIPVSKDEFLHMYTKNLSTPKADFSNAALREYITLYSRFKMKVKEAEKLHIDTLPAIQGELNSYRKQLAKTYLTDKDVTDNLVKETYNRMKKDVHVAHILINTPRGSEDTIAAYKKIDSIYNQITKKTITFEEAAKLYSDDKASGKNNGDIGFFTALQVVYPFESIAYNTPNGAISKPFKTIYGYHIIKKIEDRPARGEISVSQILATVQKTGGDAAEQKAKNKMDTVAILLKKGIPFEELVKKYSDDKFSINSDGLLQTFGTGSMVPEFENASFALKNPGDISPIIKTDFGYHIIRLNKKIPVKNYDSAKQDITKKVERDGRIDIARKMYLEKVKQKVNYKEYPNAISEFVYAVPDTILSSGKFKAADYANLKKPLYEINGIPYTQAQYANDIEKNTRGRMYGPKEAALRGLLKSYAEKAVMDYQEARLDQEFPEFKNLVTEYRDGIMLFDITDKLVWTKATTDSVGLQKYYELNKEKYKWAPCVQGELYKAVDELNAKVTMREIVNGTSKNPDDIVKTVNGNGSQNKVIVESGKFEQSKFPKNIIYTVGKPTSIFKNDDGTFSIINVKQVFNSPTTKTLTEAKGYAVSDYQEYLEQKWISDLEKKYPVVINEGELKKMIK